MCSFCWVTRESQTLNELEGFYEHEVSTLDIYRSGRCNEMSWGELYACPLQPYRSTAHKGMDRSSP